ncbi:MAG: hypothetical protein CMP98_10170 [Gammaproteobacteria bacterium]|nr:hypothetical protein [Gammaproteobacteria bacterium]OUU08366.1 MAG: hypothetical protein CBB94_10400 [Gammaproteobacteria bacterium TMED34]|tara:strand:+ start:172 stop:471 length:300 start_codon:yes stop_codon:yes gene_type:complete
MNILGQTTARNVTMALHKGDIGTLTRVLEAEPYITRTGIQPRGPQGDENRPLLHVTTDSPSLFTRCREAIELLITHSDNPWSFLSIYAFTAQRATYWVE